MFYFLSIIIIWFGFANPIFQFSAGVILFPLLMYHITLTKDTPREIIPLAWSVGATIYASCLYWIAYPVMNFTSVPLVVALACPILLGLYLGLYPLLYCIILWYARDRSLIFKFLLSLFVWSFLEYLRGTLFTGLPWLSLVEAFAPYPYLIQGLKFIGPYLFSGIIAALAIPIYEIKNKGVIPLILISFVVVFVGMMDYLASSRPHPYKYISCAAIQGNVDQYHKWDKSYQISTLEDYISLTQQALNGESLDLVVWPETAMPFYFIPNSPLLVRLLSFTKQSTVKNLLTGAPGFKMGPSSVLYFNSAYLIRKGRIIARYDKVHLVPFGEYVPLSNWLPFLKKIVEGPGNFTPGKYLHPLRVKDLAIGTLICYEVIFPELVAQEVRLGANILVNISNDAWFGKSSGPYQHLNQAILRAIESNRYLIRATNSGISAIISPRGKVLKKIGLFKRGEIVDHKIGLLKDMTFYDLHWKTIRNISLLISLFFVSVTFYKNNPLK